MYRPRIIRFGNSIENNGSNEANTNRLGLTENTEAAKWAARLCEAARHDTNGMKVYDVMNEMSVSPTAYGQIFQLNTTEGVDAFGSNFEDDSYLVVHTHQLDRRANPTRLVGLAICDEFPDDLQELLEDTTYESGYSEWNSLRTDIHIPEGVNAWRSTVASPVVNPAGEDAFQPQAKTNAPAKVGRNDPCPCGSGKKFKKCCGLDQAAKQSMADEFQSDRHEADAKDWSAILREVELEAQLLEGTPFGGFQARKLIDYWVTADTWEGLVTEVEAQTYRAPLTFFPPLRKPTPPNDRKAVRFNPTAYYMKWRGVHRPLFLQIVGTVNPKDGSLNVLETRLLMPIDLNRETIVEKSHARLALL